MKKENLTVELFISDEEKALGIFRKIRWSKNVYCPNCDSINKQ
jgi:hypothetical protein